jgi:hypothetical protein
MNRSMRTLLSRLEFVKKTIVGVERMLEKGPTVLGTHTGTLVKKYQLALDAEKNALTSKNEAAIRRTNIASTKAREDLIQYKAVRADPLL